MHQLNRFAVRTFALVALALFSTAVVLPFVSTMSAQDDEHVFGLVSVTSTDNDALSVAGGADIDGYADVGGGARISGALSLGSVVADTDTTKRLASGNAEAWRYISGSGSWASPAVPTYGAHSVSFYTNTTTTPSNILSFSVPDIPAGSVVVLSILVSDGSRADQTSTSRCVFKIRRGTTDVVSIKSNETPSTDSINGKNITVLDSPPAGTHTYALTGESQGSGNTCQANPGSMNITTMTAQVLRY